MHENPSERSYVLPLAFAMTVSMWAVAYICRLPAVTAPSWLVLALLVAAVLVWGGLTGRWTADGFQAGARVGAVTAIVNMLVLGSLLNTADSKGVTPSALWWVPGSIVLVATLAGVAARLAQSRDGTGPVRDWTALFTKVAVAASFLLVVAGGVVTSHEAGLAVVDWPNTFGYNMFLYPLSRMTGGVYYEHAHRLFGALVGLTVVVLGFRLWRRDDRGWVKRLAGLAVVLVVVQGVLGGLRVTGRFTLSTSPGDMTPSIALAVAHGVLGQLFFALLVGLAVVTSRLWRSATPAEARASAAADKNLVTGLIAVLVIQLVLGAVQRHLAQGLVIHITLAAVVVVIAVAAGSRGWGLYHGTWPVQRLGQLLLAVVSVQVALGIAALAVTQGRAVVGDPDMLEVTIATAHQAVGAVLLGLGVALLLWTQRLFSRREA